VLTHGIPYPVLFGLPLPFIIRQFLSYKSYVIEDAYIVDAGAATVLYGCSPALLDEVDDQFWQQDSPAILGTVKLGDRFAAAAR
jgi:hypothetical protein